MYGAGVDQLHWPVHCLRCAKAGQEVKPGGIADKGRRLEQEGTGLKAPYWGVKRWSGKCK